MLTSGQVPSRRLRRRGAAARATPETARRGLPGEDAPVRCRLLRPLPLPQRLRPVPRKPGTIADALERPDLVVGPEIPAHELRGDVLKAAVDFDRRGEREVAQSARAWCERVADAVFKERADSGCELSDLPDGICELALAFYRGRIATAKEQARARPVTPAAIRKRRSRVHGAARRNPVSGDDLLL
jgi:hypothetical protein